MKKGGGDNLHWQESAEAHWFHMFIALSACVVLGGFLILEKLDNDRRFSALQGQIHELQNAQ